MVRELYKRYPINFSTPIPMTWQCSGWIGKTIVIDWDDRTTSITEAKLVVQRATVDHDPLDLRIRANGVELVHYFWGEGQKSVVKTGTYPFNLNNGDNLFEARLCKHYFWLGNVGGQISGYIEIVYEGEEPKKDWFADPTVRMAILALSALAAIFSVVTVVGGRKK